MRFLDWFAGIGGFRLGLERAGWTAVPGLSASARKQVLGNAVVPAVAEWIGRQLAGAGR